MLDPAQSDRHAAGNRKAPGTKIRHGHEKAFLLIPQDWSGSPLDAIHIDRDDDFFERGARSAAWCSLSKER